MYPQSMFWAKIRKKYKKKKSAENLKFLQLRKNLYITWACFRIVYMVHVHVVRDIFPFHVCEQDGYFV